MWEIEVENRHDKLDELPTSIDWVYENMRWIRPSEHWDWAQNIYDSFHVRNESLKFEFSQSINFSISCKNFVSSFCESLKFLTLSIPSQSNLFAPLLYLVVAEASKFPSLPSVSYNFLRSEHITANVNRLWNLNNLPSVRRVRQSTYSWCCFMQLQDCFISSHLLTVLPNFRISRFWSVEEEKKTL